MKVPMITEEDILLTHQLMDPLQKGLVGLLPESQTTAALTSSCDVMLPSFGSFLRGPNPEDGGGIFL
jgi:hypothetical protein